MKIFMFFYQPFIDSLFIHMLAQWAVCEGQKQSLTMICSKIPESGKRLVLSMEEASAPISKRNY